MMPKWITTWGYLTCLGWGVLTFFKPEALLATPLDRVSNLFLRDPNITAVHLVGAGALTIMGIWINRDCILTRVMLFPQTFLMLVACAGSIQAIAQGHYADGVERPWAFILADQLPWIVAAITYTFAVVDHFVTRGKLWNTGFRYWRR